MRMDGAHPRSWASRRHLLLLSLAALFAGSLALGLFFLIRPMFGSAPYYKVGWRENTYKYSQQVLLLFVPYALALYAWHRGARISAWLLLGGAVLLHLVVLFAPLPQSQDFYQYLFYGRMQAAYHANPYVFQPQANGMWLDNWYS